MQLLWVWGTCILKSWACMHSFEKEICKQTWGVVFATPAATADWYRQQAMICLEFYASSERTWIQGGCSDHQGHKDSQPEVWQQDSLQNTIPAKNRFPVPDNLQSKYTHLKKCPYKDRQKTVRLWLANMGTLFSTQQWSNLSKNVDDLRLELRVLGFKQVFISNILIA